VPDVRPFLAQAAVVVVPLLVGGGTRIKIFEAMAMARPVVSTPLGAEGLKVRAGDEIVLAESAEQFAGAVSRLLADRDLRKSIGQAARRVVCRHFSAEAVARQFEAACHDVVALESCLPC
jgi:glycosyltransferase involved in cell wall biosynthesis